LKKKNSNSKKNNFLWNRPVLILLILILTFSFNLFTSAEEIQLPETEYQSFSLDNGLKVMVFPDQEVPLLRLSIYYRVGSIDERVGKTGISHFLEHVMFLGTEAVPKGKIDQLISSVGGYLNAATSFDYTYYYHEVPSSMLELVMALEADRMQNLKIDPEEVAREKEVIKQERRLRTENNIFSSGFEEIKAASFPDSYLEHNVIGWMEDIESINTKDLQNYYQRYYSPNNAVLVLSGDVEIEDVKRHAEKYYADIKREKINRPNLQLPKQEEGIVHEVYLDTNIPYSLMFYRIPAGNSRDIIALEIFLEILANQDSSRLKEKLQKEENLIMAAGGYLYQLREPSFALVYMIPAAEEYIQKSQQEYDKIISELLKNGIRDEEFEMIKKQYKKSLIFSQKDINQAAASSALNELRYGNAELEKEQIEILNNLSREDIINIAAKYFGEDNMSMGYILPKEEGGQQ